MCEGGKIIITFISLLSSHGMVTNSPVVLLASHALVVHMHPPAHTSLSMVWSLAHTAPDPNITTRAPIGTTPV